MAVLRDERRRSFDFATWRCFFGSPSGNVSNRLVCIHRRTPCWTAIFLRGTEIWKYLDLGKLLALLEEQKIHSSREPGGFAALLIRVGTALRLRRSSTAALLNHFGAGLFVTVLQLVCELTFGGLLCAQPCHCTLTTVARPLGRMPRTEAFADLPSCSLEEAPGTTKRVKKGLSARL